MRFMNLSGLLVGPSSADECIELYSKRVGANDAPWPQVSMLLTAYMAWPNNEAARDSFAASYMALQLGRPTGKDVPAPSDDQPVDPKLKALQQFGGLKAIANPALDFLCDKIAQQQRGWLLVADIFQLIVDMAHENRIILRRGPSVSKAVELCEVERALPGHSQIRKAWSGFRDVAHLITAGAYIARQARVNDSELYESSLLEVVWRAPDALVALGAGFEQFGLEPKQVDKEESILRPQKLWRVPPDLKPQKPFVIFRRLTESQLAYLQTRRAPKKYLPHVSGQRVVSHKMAVKEDSGAKRTDAD
jgi:hypothetical protein